MSPEEIDALIRENHRLKMLIVRAFRELDPHTEIDTNSDMDALSTLPWNVRNQIRHKALEAAQ
ncbi:hypothetical protein [Rhizobium sp.]|jgi:hypothetical protein|uniref:hypothetical protein n=1 Tax=Rhizobium sp. TaxID=391 RepID=UPI000E8EDB46|nr:hypothetical protein [Rhizobium sp.]